MNSIPINKKDSENLSFFQDLSNVKIPDIGNITIKDRKKLVQILRSIILLYLN